MVYAIFNDYLALSADTRGAELQSIKGTRGGIEYLWQGDPEIWNGHAPLLFPIIGRLKRGAYTLGDRSYPMSLHGFANASEFRGEKKNDDSLSFFLEDSPETRASWPFRFGLEIRYTLRGPAVKKEHILTNKGESELLYELGGHEGYNVAQSPGESMEDYYIQFRGMDSISVCVLDSDVLITREKKIIPLEGGRLKLDMQLFDNDALILDELQGREVTIANTKNEDKVRVSFPDFGYLGIWTMASKRETKFVCIEPWSSLPDCAYLDERLENKIGIRRLAAGASETLSYTMEFGELERGLGAAQ